MCSFLNAQILAYSPREEFLRELDRKGITTALAASFEQFGLPTRLVTLFTIRPCLSPPQVPKHLHCRRAVPRKMIVGINLVWASLPNVSPNAHAELRR